MANTVLHDTSIYEAARHEVSRLTLEIADVLGEIDRLLADHSSADGDVLSLAARIHPLREERGAWLALTNELDRKPA